MDTHSFTRDTTPLHRRYDRASVTSHLATLSGNRVIANKVLDGVEFLMLQAIAKNVYGVEVARTSTMTFDNFVDSVMKLLKGK